MCGIVALILGHLDNHSAPCLAAADLHEALYYLQHRGQDACGIATCAAGGRIYQCKGNGMAAQVFRDGKRVLDLPGFMGIGHLRYPTAGTSYARVTLPTSGEVAEGSPKLLRATRIRRSPTILCEQPYGIPPADFFVLDSPYGLCLSHNGNLINAPELREFLDQKAHRHINTDSDSELMLNIFANELNETGKARVNTDDIFKALDRMYQKCQGAFACTGMVAGFGILGFRDPDGIRPLVLGSRPSETLPGAKDYMLASEDIALRQLHFSNIQDILPGQAVFIQKGREPEFRQLQDKKLPPAVDMFEYVYFARPDTVMDGISVHRSRQNMGYKLAEKIRATLGEDGVEEIDAVIPIPETATTSAAVVAEHLNRPFCQAYVKNRYVQRTFILPEQGARQKSVRRKLSTIEELFAGRCVLLIDDSLVRGTTSREIVSMAREAGARKVIMASCSPPITNPHIYGIDLASQSELIAHNRDTHEIASHINADQVIFQSLDDLVAACAELSPRGLRTQRFEVGVFTGCYTTAVPDGYFERLNQVRGKKRKTHVAVEETRGPVLTANSGPVAGGCAVSEGAAGSLQPPEAGLQYRTRRGSPSGPGVLRVPSPYSPGNREDISLHNVATDPGDQR